MGMRLIGFALVVLLIGLSGAVLINSPTDEATQNIRFETQETAVINDRLQIYAGKISPSDPENATITLTDTETLESETKTIATGGNATYTLGSETITVAVTAISDTSDGKFVDTAIHYSPTYGWGPAAKTFVDNLAVILAIMALTIFVGVGVGGVTEL